VHHTSRSWGTHGNVGTDGDRLTFPICCFCYENSPIINLLLRDLTFSGKLPGVPAYREFAEVQKDLDGIVVRIKATNDPAIRHSLLQEMMLLIKEALGEVEVAAAASGNDPQRDVSR